MKIHVTKSASGFQVYFRDAFGKRYRRVHKVATAKEARELAAVQFSQHGAAKTLKATPISIADAIQSYLTLESSRKVLSSRHLDARALGLFSEVIRSTNLADLGPVMVASFTPFCLARNFKAATCNRFGNSVRHFLGWCFSKEWLSRDLRRHVQRAKGPSRESRCLEPDELRRLFQVACPNLKLAMRIACCCGLRGGEIVSLRWDSISFERFEMQVGGASHFQAKAGKSRCVPIPEPMLKELSAWKMSQKLFSPFVFSANDLARHIERRVLSRSFSRAAKRAGINNARFHDLRATAAVTYAEAGFGETTIAKILGHASTAMSRKYASTIETRVQREAVEQAFVRSHESTKL